MYSLGDRQIGFDLADGLTELARGVDQVGGSGGGVIVLVETKVGLRQDLAKEFAEKGIQRQRICPM